MTLVGNTFARKLARCSWSAAARVTWLRTMRWRWMAVRGWSSGIRGASSQIRVLLPRLTMTTNMVGGTHRVPQTGMESSVLVSDVSDDIVTPLRDLTDGELYKRLLLKGLGAEYSVNEYLGEMSRRDNDRAAKRTFWTAVASTVAAVFSALAAFVTIWVSLTSPAPSCGTVPSSVGPSASTVVPPSPTR
jgi:hypothetical protein